MTPIYERPVELLQNLIRFDTTNPPGNEKACIDYINHLLQTAGIETTLIARDPNRPNLIARLKGEGKAAPLLLYGHVDVVTTENQEWEQPPFAANIVDGCVWGRGALDMKSGVAMLLCAFLRAKAEGLKLPMDLVLAIVSDEEAGGDFGAKFLVENHAHLFEGIRYAIGEFGGFTSHMGGKRLYPIGVAEKQACSVRAILRGAGGHGSIRTTGGAMAKLGRVLQLLDEKRLPVHITPAVQAFIEQTATALPEPQNQITRQLLNPDLTDTILDQMGESGRNFDSLLHHTVNATIIHGGSAINVIPSQITVDMDGRLLPGFKPEDMLAELHQLLGDDIEFQVISYDPGAETVDLSLFDTLGEVLHEFDPEAIPVPLVLRGVTDGRFFARLGIQTYGFLPMLMPDGLNFTNLIHGANERIPVEAMDFGANMLYRALQRINS